VCKILSGVAAGSGQPDEYSYGEPVHPKDQPTVQISYIRNYLSKPLLIEDLRHKFPDLDVRLFKGPRNSSIPLSQSDFLKILSLLSESEETLNTPTLSDLVRADLAREHEARRKLTDIEIIQRALDSGKIKPRQRLTATTYYFPRNPYVAQAVKLLAKGICDLCATPAPFQNNDGTPFLECHHVEMLAVGGSDSLNNTVALCPNCHRRVHIIASASDKERLRDRIKRRNGEPGQLP
jgi:5-methylcytosine-specific restriction endonuclease McrA